MKLRHWSASWEGHSKYQEWRLFWAVCCKTQDKLLTNLGMWQFMSVLRVCLSNVETAQMGKRKDHMRGLQFFKRVTVTSSCSLIYCIKLNSKLIVNREFWDGLPLFCLFINLMTMRCLPSIVVFQLAFFPGRKNIFILSILNLHRR